MIPFVSNRGLLDIIYIAAGAFKLAAALNRSSKMATTSCAVVLFCILYLNYDAALALSVRGGSRQAVPIARNREGAELRSTV